MNKIKSILSGKNEKALSITKIVCSAIIFVFAIIQLTGIWDKATYVFMPFLGISMLIQTIEYWNKNRKVAIFSLLAALFVFVSVSVIVIVVDMICNS